MMEAVVIPPFERFYDEHRDEVFGVLVRRLGRQPGRGRVPGDVPPGPARLRRASTRRVPAGLGADDRRATSPSTPSAASSPTAELEETGACATPPAYAELEHLTGDLPPTERAAVVLRYAYDLPYAAIGAALGSSEDAARQAASAGVRRLREGGSHA